MGKHNLAIDILKTEIDLLTKTMTTKEQQVANLVYELEELKLSQQEIIESIKHLGVSNAEQTTPTVIVAGDPSSTGQS